VAVETSFATGVEGICAELEALQVACDGGRFTGNGVPPELWLGTMVVAGTEVVGGVCAGADAEPVAGISTESSR
jgi:hypothetical protein